MFAKFLAVFCRLCIQGNVLYVHAFYVRYWYSRNVQLWIGIQPA